MSSTGIRKLFEGWPGSDPNPTLRQLASSSPEVLEPEPDSSALVLLPGDDVKGHPLYAEPNPYMRMGFFELKALVESRTLDAAEQRQAAAALSLKRLAHTGHTGRTR